MITNAIKGPNEFDTGQRTSMLKALIISERSKVFTGPMKSDKIPQHSRPTADEKLKPATRPAPADGDSPSDAA
jgi:hypothetical protein